MRAVFVSSLIIPLLLAATVSAKGVTSGPGTFINGVEGTEGFIIDWSSGPVAARPSGLRRYEVLFYGATDSGGAQPTYVVVYENDPSSGLGFVYLPGKSDEHYSLNTRTISRGHGLEGRWFRATTAWQNAVAKLMPAR